MAIAAAAILALWKTAGSGTDTPEIAILTSAFTAISTMTTAYFGIKTQAHTAQSFAGAVHTAVAGVTGKAAGGDDGDGSDSPSSGPPVPRDPSNPTAAEIVARMAEPED